MTNKKPARPTVSKPKPGRNLAGHFTPALAAKLAKQHKPGHPWRQWQGPAYLRKDSSHQ